MKRKIILLDDYNQRVVRRGVIGSITPQFGNLAPRNGWKIIYKQQDMEQELKKEKDENGMTWYLDEESGRWHRFRIRKLTPRECFRLMGVRDKDIDTIQAAGISNSQQYKMAGNSIVVDQLTHLFMQMFSPDRKVGRPMPRQLSLF